MDYVINCFCVRSWFKNVSVFGVALDNSFSVLCDWFRVLRSAAYLG